MAKKDKLIKSKSIYSIKNRHSKTNNGIIYENDHITIIPNDGIYDNEMTLFSESNFKFKVRTDKTNKKKHVRGSFVKPLSGNDVWTLNDLKDVEKSDESRIVLKPNYSSLKDFAYYGSAVELIKATVNSVVQNFPGGLQYYINGPAVYTNDNEKWYLVSNEFEIDCWNGGDILSETNVKNPMRVIMASYKNYEDKNGKELKKPIILLNKTTCPKSIIGTVKLNSETLSIYMDGDGKKYLVSKKQGVKDENNIIIKVKSAIVDKYWSTMDDFERVLLNRDTFPPYKAIFETPYENEVGFFYENQSYMWPTVNDDNFTPDITTGAFQGYLESLISLATFHDEYDSDNIWRMMTHESIKNLDWTFTSNQDGIEQDLSEFDTRGIGAMTRIYGRQFDDIKRYIDNIKSTNSVTYDEKNNIPDYFLSDTVEHFGWEAYNVANFNDIILPEISNSANTIHTTSGKTSDYVNSSFLRRLILNSPYIQSMKGTRRGIEAILNMFGYTYDKNIASAGTFKIDEYVYTIDSALTYSKAKQLRTAGEYAYGDNTENLMEGYPVAPVIIGDNIDDERTYLIPWFDNKQTYRNPFYFQGKGGWGKRDTKKVNLKELTGSETTEINSSKVGIYGETQPYMRFVSDITEMLNIDQTELLNGIVCYVTDISLLKDLYVSSEKDKDKKDFSHYFILKNVALSSFCGFVSNDLYNCYGWKNVYQSEMKNGTLSEDGSKVLYLESLETIENGNNPHNGYGQYDDGEEYIERYTNLFKHAFDEGLYDYMQNGDSDDMENYNLLSNGYGFSANCVVDNYKCAYFKDYGDDSSLLSIGAKDNVEWNCKQYDLDFNPENVTISNNEPYDESQANGIINVKNLLITFGTKDKNGNKNQFLRDYITNVVSKYLEHMIPSTSILRYKFDNDATEVAVESISIDYGEYNVVRAAHVAVTNNEDIVYWNEVDLTKTEDN